MRIKDALIVATALGIASWMATSFTESTKIGAIIVGGTTWIVSMFICLAYMFVEKVLDQIFAPKSDGQ